MPNTWREPVSISHVLLFPQFILKFTKEIFRMSTSDLPSHLITGSQLVLQASYSGNIPHTNRQQRIQDDFEVSNAK